MADIVLRNESATGERLRPDIARLQKKLAAHPPELAADIRDHLQESLDIAVAWLELYKTLRARLLGLASERRSTPHGVLRARPVKGGSECRGL